MNSEHRVHMVLGRNTVKYAGRKCVRVCKKLRWCLEGGRAFTPSPRAEVAKFASSTWSRSQQMGL